MKFDPSARASSDSGIFGLPHSAEDSKVILIPVPWEATTSYGGGTADAPQAIFEASRQVDLFDLETGKAYEHGYHMLPIPNELQSKSVRAKSAAERVRELEEDGGENYQSRTAKQEVNDLCVDMNEWVYTTAQSWLKKDKFVGLIGGDHSSPHGLIRACSEKLNGDFGILHLDAHHDLRNSYEGFKFSHASIFYNVMQADWAPKKLVQVGIRDFSEDEYLYAKERGITTFYDMQIQRRKGSGEPWMKICEDIVSGLPTNVYVSFDIDGLSPTFCPNTGTPVAGGLDYAESLILFRTLVESKRKIIGFDVNEVSPGSSDSEWDANVGARQIYKLCGWTLVSNGIGSINS
jgi:agmatinase